MSTANACIITAAVSGAVANKEQCPGIPYTPEEYAKEVRRARDAGASMVHIHARTPEGLPTVEVEHFWAITQAILAEAPDVIVNYSTVGSACRWPSASAKSPSLSRRSAP